MSFSTGFKSLRNPCQYFLEHKSEDGGIFQFWRKFDNPKQGEPRGENVRVDLSVFVILEDSLFTVSGFSEQLKTNLYSNEVRSLDDELDVRYKQHGGTANTLAKGSYQEIKDKVKSLGGKYTQSVYILFPESSIQSEEFATSRNWVLGNIKIKGASLNSWINFRERAVTKFGSNFIGVVGHEHKDKRANSGKVITEWEEPQFGVLDPIPTDVVEIARDEDVNLQSYLKEYLKSGAPNDQDQRIPYDVEDENQDIPEETSQQPTRETVEDTVNIQDGPPAEDWNDDSAEWASYKPRSGNYPELGKCSVDQLNEMRKIMEDGNFTNTQQYRFVIRGIAEKQKESKSGGNPFGGGNESPI